MRLIIAGGRDYFLQSADLEYLDTVKRQQDRNGDAITIVMHGGATGADLGGKIWATANEIETQEFKADWRAYGTYAGPKRNREMAKSADAVVLFPGGDGTESMFAEAKSFGLTIFDRRNNSSYKVEQSILQLEDLATQLHCIAKAGPIGLKDQNVWATFESLHVKTANILRGLRCSTKYS